MKSEEEIKRLSAYHADLAARAAYNCLCNQRSGLGETAAGNYHDFLAHYSLHIAFEEVLN